MGTGSCLSPKQNYPVFITGLFWGGSKMLLKFSKVYCLFLATATALILLTGCSQPQETHIASLIEGVFDVDPVFQKFYEQMGGIEVLGPAISPTFSYGSRRFQYTEAACLEYNADLSPNQAFRLAALGLDIGIFDPPVPPPGDPDVLYIDGHTVSGEFARFYHKLGGARFVGRPLTEMHFNSIKNRFEQYFENVGFYWVVGNPPEEIKLLAYGAWKCDVFCRKQPLESAVVEIQLSFLTTNDNLFHNAVSRLGPDFTGFPLSSVYQAGDGSFEQIYENLVLFSSEGQSARVSLRPLTNLLGILSDPLETQLILKDMFFYPIEGSLGYNVPQVFLDYITMHGGIEISGPPIGKIYLINDSVWRQCFSNLCLEYHMNPNIPVDLRIRPQPLGYLYQEFISPHIIQDFQQSQTLKSITLHVWERHPVLGTNGSQTIAAGVFEGNNPLMNIEPILIIDLYEGGQKQIHFPPTGPDGYTYIKLDPINAQHGTLIPYQVCISSLMDEIFCVKESFVIWYDY
jgi:hypothetical protein